MRRSQKTNYVDVHVGKQVQSGRLLRGMGQVELAKQLGIAFRQVQKYETGINRISVSRLWQVGKILDMPISYFFEGLNRNENAANEAQITDAVRQLLDELEVSSEPVKTAVSQLLKSMTKDPKPRSRKTAK